MSRYEGHPHGTWDGLEYDGSNHLRAKYNPYLRPAWGRKLFAKHPGMTAFGLTILILGIPAIFIIGVIK